MGCCLADVDTRPNLRQLVSRQNQPFCITGPAVSQPAARMPRAYPQRASQRGCWVELLHPNWGVSLATSVTVAPAADEPQQITGHVDALLHL